MLKYLSEVSNRIKFILATGLLLASFNGITTSKLDEVYEAPAKYSEQAQAYGSKEGKWLPIPIPVSNPTVGSGLQLALLYLHPKDEQDSDAPNATTGIGGMWTDSDSKFLGIFHDDSFYEDHFRLKTYAGVTDFNLDYFGVGDQQEETSIKYNIKTTLVSSEFLFLLPSTESWFIGPKQLWIDAQLTFPIDTELFEIEDLVIDSITSSLGFVVNYDSRNDNYYPSKGQLLNFSYLKDDPNWGSDYKFEKTLLKYHYYLPVTNKHIIALKGLVSNVGGDAPFYMMSNLSIRGASFGRYIDNVAASLHAEWRYKFAERWGVVGFVETGKVSNTLSELSDSETIQSYGAGIRWQAISSKALNVGLDVAFSEGENTLYVRVGESF